MSFEIKFHYYDSVFEMEFDFVVRHSEIYDSISVKIQKPTNEFVLKSKNKKLKNNSTLYEYVMDDEIHIELVEEKKEKEIVDGKYKNRHKSGFVGMKNDRNSPIVPLLQSLYNINAFRNLVYNWTIEELREKEPLKKEKKSLMKKIQFLITELDTADKKYIKYDTSIIKSIDINEMMMNQEVSDYYVKLLIALNSEVKFRQDDNLIDYFCTRLQPGGSNIASLNMQEATTIEQGIKDQFRGKTVVSFPKYMFLHLSKRTVFKKHLDLNHFPNGKEFDLFQIGYNCGNYMNKIYGVYAQNENTGKWYNFINEKVKECTEDEAFGIKGVEYLIYRRRDFQIPDPIPIPESVLEETNTQRLILEEKKRLKNMYHFFVYFGKIENVDRPWKLTLSEAPKDLYLNKSETISQLKLKAAELWGVSDVTDQKFRIRKFSTEYKLGLEIYDLYQNYAIQTTDLMNLDTLVLELAPLDFKFREHEKIYYVLKVIVYDKQNNSFSEEECIPFDFSMKVSEMRKILEKFSGIPEKRMKIFMECFGDLMELNSIYSSLSDTYLKNGSRLYLEENDPYSTFSPCLSELENLKNQVLINYNSLSESPLVDLQDVAFDRSLKIDKRSPIYVLIQLIAMDFKCSDEEIKIFSILEKDYEKVRIEIRNISQNISEFIRSRSNICFYVEKTKPFTLPQVVLTFYHYQPIVFSYLEKNPFQTLTEEDNKNLKLYTEVFELLVDSSIPVNKLRSQVFEQLESVNIQKPSSPLHIRLREVYSFAPSTVIPNCDELTLLQCVDNVVYHGKPIAFQFIEEPEPVTQKNSFVVPIVQRWFPSTYTFGPRVELVLDVNMTIEDLKKLLSQKFNIENIGISKSKKIENFHSDMKSLVWDPLVPLFISKKNEPTITTSPLFLNDGQILFFKDNNEKEKILDQKEKTQIESFSKNNKALSLIATKDKGKKKEKN